MCGITGIINFKGNINATQEKALHDSLKPIQPRGPDFQDVFIHEKTGLGHARLSIIDTSSKANQPFTDKSGRYTIVLNGEIYNYKELKQKYISEIDFVSESDTEVLLYLYIRFGKDVLEKLNGFFAFAVYDKQKKTIFLARDRVGIKPLLYSQTDNFFCFASDLRSLSAAAEHLGIEKEIDKTALSYYLQLNYIPAPFSIIKSIKKLEHGHCIEIDVEKSTVDIQQYYKIEQKEATGETYKAQKNKLRELLISSVEKRMVSDVPLGTFLSGGIDSSIISGIASKINPHLNTFSIGYKDNAFFDESKHAERMATALGTNHHSFILSNDELYANLDVALDSMDEPFGDSSAIVVYALSKETRKIATVALSGDGADEMFAGYNKHYASLMLSKKGLRNICMRAGRPVWRCLPKSRNNALLNKFRQIDRYSYALKLNEKERYWYLCSIALADEANRLLVSDADVDNSNTASFLKNIDGDYNNYLIFDQNFVLQNDMLKKVDLMSMGNSLEVRVPFLDHHLLEFVNSLQADYKIKNKARKIILKDAFKDILPEDIANRPKHGFEVPLQDWFKGELLTELNENLFNEELIQEQAIFDFKEISLLKQQLFSRNVGDAVARIWGLYVFQKWYRKNLSI